MRYREFKIVENRAAQMDAQDAIVAKYDKVLLNALRQTGGDKEGMMAAVRALFSAPEFRDYWNSATTNDSTYFSPIKMRAREIILGPGANPGVDSQTLKGMFRDAVRNIKENNTTESRTVEADAGETDPDNPTPGEVSDISSAKDANQLISSEALTAGPPYPREEMAAVKALQTKLEKLGYSVGNTGIDGKYGPRTTRAVRAFKKDYNIAGDGITADAATLQKLDSVISGSIPKAERPTAIASGSDGLEYPISNSRIESIIRDEAELRGIDPDIAVRIFRAEGRSSYQSTVPRTGKGSLNGREASFGPYQLYIGGGLGNEYQDKTGRDLTQDNTEDGITNQIRFALDAAVRQSWQPWYGRGPAGVGRYDGLRGARQARNWS